MSMLRVTNDNKNVEEKINFFLSRFYHFLGNIGKEFQFEFEDQLSLLHKIQFQLTNEIDFRFQYIDQYMSNQILLQTDHWSSYNTYEEVRKRISLYQEASKSKKSRKEIDKVKKEILDSVSFQNALRDLIREVSHKIPEILCNTLLKTLICEHPLMEHDHVTKLNLIAKHFVSRGYYTRKNAGEIDTIVKGIFDHRYTFPYPPEIKGKRERKKFQDEKTLENQVRGFGEIAREKHTTAIIIMKLFGPKFPSEFSFEYNGVYFLGLENPKINSLRSALDLKNIRYRNFFKDENCLYIGAKLSFYTHLSLVEKMKMSTKNQIQFLSTYFDRNFTLDTTQNYLILNSRWRFKGGRSSTNSLMSIDKDLVDNLKDNAFSILKKVKNNKAAKWFLSMEPIFIQAMRYHSITDYWTYLEALIPITQQKEKQVKQIVSTIMLTSEKKRQDNRILKTLHNTLDWFNGNMDLLEVGNERLKFILHDLEKNKIAKEIRNIDLTFIQDLVSEFDNDLTKLDYLNAKDYYYGILNEAYSQRNFAIHQGINDDNIQLKMRKTLPFIIVQFRCIIINEIKQNPEIDFDYLIESLKEKGLKLMGK